MRRSPALIVPTAMRSAFVAGLNTLRLKAKQPVELFVGFVRGGRFGDVARNVARSLEGRAGLTNRHRLWSVQRNG